MFKEIFPPKEGWFKDYHVKLDLGFKGFADAYDFKSLEIPHKKPKGKELIEAQKKENSELASKRVVVEHAIGGLKRYRVLSDRLRMKNYEHYDDLLGICAGLWNFSISI